MFPFIEHCKEDDRDPLPSISFLEFFFLQFVPKKEGKHVPLPSFEMGTKGSMKHYEHLNVIVV